MKTKEKKQFQRRRAGRVWTVVALLTFVYVWSRIPVPMASSAGIDDAAVTLGSETTGAENQITVAFTPTTSLDTSDVIKIYLGENTVGNEFTDGDADQSGADIACTQSGATFGSGTYAAASATVPMLYTITKASGTGSTAAVSCTLGASGTDGPNNPSVAGNYSVGVVSTDDSGAGIAYVGNANDVTVSATVLPNLSLTIDGADATICTTASGITSCNLGVVTTGAVNSGNYDVNVGTNAASGATLKIGEDGNLRNGSDVITDLVEDTGGTVTAGVDEYGIAVVSDASWTESGNYTDDDTPIPTGPATVATTAGPIASSGDDVTVTHKAAVSSTVKALTYSHIVTWTATANF